MRFRQIDVLGYQAGTLIATELAIARPTQVRRVVMVSVPVLNDTERDAFRRGSWLPSEDGSHLLTEWKRTLESYRPGVPLEVRARAFAEKLKSGIHAAWALAAAQQYASRERLALVTQTSLVLRPKDDFWEATLRARELLSKARFIDLPEQGNGLFEAAPRPSLSQPGNFCAAERPREPVRSTQEGVYVTSARQLSHFSLEYRSAARRSVRLWSTTN